MESKMEKITDSISKLKYTQQTMYICEEENGRK